jgi:hypothetical protein
MFKYLLRRRYGITGNYFGNVGSPRSARLFGSPSQAYRYRHCPPRTCSAEILERQTQDIPHGAERSSSARNHLRRCAGPSDLFFSQLSTFNFQLSSFRIQFFFDLELRRQSLSFFLEPSNDRYSAYPRSENCQRQLPPFLDSPPRRRRSAAARRAVCLRLQIASWVSKAHGTVSIDLA